MKRTWKTASALCSALCLLVVTQAMGQITQPRNQKPALERETAGQQKICLASKVTKMMVKDSANQTIGQVQDLVMDESGQVQFVAITVRDAAATDRLQPRTPGGARPDQPAVRPQPGAGARELPGAQTAKLTLVPFEALAFHEGETEAQSYVSLTIDKDRISQAPTFTVQQLTAQGQEAQWMSQLNKFYEREKSGAARPDLNGQPNRNNGTIPNRPNRNDPNNPNRPDRNDLDRDDQPRIERNDDQPRIERSDEQPKRDE